MTTTNSPNQRLRSFIDEIARTSPEEAREIVKKIKSECGITNYVYANWRSGRTKIKLPEQKIINKAVGRQIFQTA